MNRTWMPVAPREDGYGRGHNAARPSAGRLCDGRARRQLDDECEKLNQLLDVLAVGRAPDERVHFPVAVVALAETAAWLQAALGVHSASPAALRRPPRGRQHDAPTRRPSVRGPRIRRRRPYSAPWLAM